MNSHQFSLPDPYHPNLVQLRGSVLRISPPSKPQNIRCTSRLDEFWPPFKSAPVPKPTTITITPENIDQYRTGLYPHIAKIMWGAGSLNAGVLRNFPSLKTLGCSDTQLTSLAGLEGCPQLLELYCSGCKLISLEGLENCRQLTTLYCARNKLTKLTGIRHCKQLVTLCCSDNLLTTLDLISNCPQLVELNCAGNRLVTLAGLEGCTQLKTLYCSDNGMTSLTGIENCIQLRELYCNRNELTTLDAIIHLRQLYRVSYNGNPLNIQSPQISRFLNLMGNFDTNSSIYANRQSVHDMHIQKTVCDSVKRLMLDPKPVFTTKMITDSGLDDKTVRLLLQYCNDKCVHSVHLLTYEELLAYVWARICRSKHRTELLKILAEQIADSEGMCFTGRFNRTLSVLAGFDPDIVIEISDSSRIGAIVIAARDRVKPYDARQHRKLARSMLTEAGYDDTATVQWLGAISEL